jgi:hypothetical protein
VSNRREFITLVGGAAASADANILRSALHGRREVEGTRAEAISERRRSGAMRQYHVRHERDQFGRMPANLGGIGCGPAGMDLHVAADGPAQKRQPLQERPEEGLILRIIRGCGQEHADASHPRGLLRARGERPRSRPAEYTDKFPPPHLSNPRHRTGQDYSTLAKGASA